MYHLAIALFLVCTRICLALNCSRVNDTRYRDVCKQFWSDVDLPLSSGLYSMLGRDIGFRRLTSRYDIISLYGYFACGHSLFLSWGWLRRCWISPFECYSDVRNCYTVLRVDWYITFNLQCFYIVFHLSGWWWYVLTEGMVNGRRRKGRRLFLTNRSYHILNATFRLHKLLFKVASHYL